MGLVYDVAASVSRLVQHSAWSLEHLPLAGYFALIVYLLCLLAPALARRPNLSSVTFAILALAALWYTWTYMILYFERSFIEAALRANVRPHKYTTKAWLSSTSLFFEAWSRVCGTARTWFWSEQLCSWVAGPMTIFLAAESRRRGVKRPWAYMLLGQVVAISFAQGLYLSVLSHTRQGRTLAATPQGRSLAIPRTASEDQDGWKGWLLPLCVFASLATVGLSPFLTKSPPAFLANLLVMHALLVIPLLPSVSQTAPRVSYSHLYLATALVAFLLRLPTFAQIIAIPSPFTASSVDATLLRFGRDALATFFEHPAQTSISYDVVFTSLSFLVWVLCDYTWRKETSGEGWVMVGLLLVLTPVAGIATTGGLYLARREVWHAEDDAKALKEKAT